MFESSINLLGKIANLFTSLLTIVIAILIIRFIFYLNYSFCRKREKWEKEKREKSDNKSKKEYPWQCLLIDGVWGSGKTTYYKKHYQYIDDKPNIYISCFSASRSELIAQIIQQQFWCKLLTLNGLLAKLMESNWQMFMPKNRVMVFDDLERLHTNQDNYLDLIGVIDYLKDRMECKIILICNMSELKAPIFNSYMERIVDDVRFAPKLSDLASLFKERPSGRKLGCAVIEKANNICLDFYLHNKINNLRIIVTVIERLINDLDQQYPKIDTWDHYRKVIYAETFSGKIANYILIRCLFFQDYSLFTKAFKKETEETGLSLDAYGLQLETFENGRLSNNINDLFRLEFKEADCIMFVFENLNKFLGFVRPRIIYDLGNEIINAGKNMGYAAMENIGFIQNDETTALARLLDELGGPDEDMSIDAFAEQIDNITCKYTSYLCKISSDVINLKEYIQNENSFFFKLINDKEWIPIYKAGSGYSWCRYLALGMFLSYINLDIAEKQIIEKCKSIIKDTRNLDLSKDIKDKPQEIKNMVINSMYRKYFLWFCDRKEYRMPVKQLSEIYDTFIRKVNNAI